MNGDPLQLRCKLQFHSFAILDLPVKMGSEQPVQTSECLGQNKVLFTLLMGAEDPSRIKRLGD